MSGLSIGWFDPAIFHPRPQQLADAVRRHLRRVSRKDAVRELPMSADVALVEVSGCTPIRALERSAERPDEIFMLVLHAEGRPALLSANVGGNFEELINGTAPPQSRRPFAIGITEMRAGMSLHYSRKNVWHGFTALPLAGETISAVAVAVTGYAATDIQGAVGAAATLLSEELAAIGAAL